MAFTLQSIAGPFMTSFDSNLRADHALAVALAALIATLFAMTLAAATPSHQQAIVQHGVGGPEVLKLESVPVLSPGKGEVLIRVYAAAINPVDWKRRKGGGDYAMDPKGLPVMIPGGDVAGVIEKVGEGVTALKVGEPVFALLPRDPKRLNGGYSQYAIAPAANVMPKPKSFTYGEAAGLGIATVTGVRVVVDAKVSKGQRVLITGASGGVGTIAVQSAKARGAYVIGTASGRREEFLKSIGIDEFVDYTKGNFEDKVKNVDVVIDTVGADTTDRAFKTVRRGGHFVSVATRNYEAKCAAANVTCPARFNAFEVGRPIFEEVAKLAAAGKLNVYIDKTFPLAQAAAAQMYSEQGRTQGKINLIVDPLWADQRSD
ncbi:MAG TPA: NADP-dependent oxidoreductase [Steroidobacteraceae bacterium]|nr:NADP-dependent oxidoreductase [Steroidobacteraceae bacterium]